MSEDNTTLTCQEVSRLLSDGMDRELSGSERTRLRLHLVICTACRNVEAQMNFLRSAMRRMGREDDAGKD